MKIFTLLNVILIQYFHIFYKLSGIGDPLEFNVLSIINKFKGGKLKHILHIDFNFSVKISYYQKHHILNKRKN